MKAGNYWVVTAVDFYGRRLYSLMDAGELELLLLLQKKMGGEKIVYIYIPDIKWEKPIIFENKVHQL